MKKLIVACMGLLCVGFLCSCSASKEPLIVFSPDAAVEVIHHGAGAEQGSWSFGTEEGIAELNEWVSQLSLKHRQYNENETPGHLDGGQSYYFSVDGEILFTYVDNGDGAYVLKDDEWYEVKNPTLPME